MITVRFSGIGANLTGFSVHGHAGLAPHGQDILCAAVSSAAYMTVNTITEIYGVSCVSEVNDGEMKVRLSAKDAQAVQPVLKGFSLHVRALSRQYPKHLKVIYGGTENA